MLNQKLDPDALEIPLHVFRHRGKLFAREVHRVGVQLVQHGLDGHVDKSGSVEGVDVQIFDAVQDVHEPGLVARPAHVLVERPAAGQVVARFPGATAPAQPKSDHEGQRQSQRLPVLHSGRATIWTPAWFKNSKPLGSL